MLKFTVDLQPSEYQQAMLWYQFRATPLKRLNEIIAWSVLILTPLTVLLLLLIAPDALSIWFWPVAIVAVLYALYSTLVIRYQIRSQARTLLADKPALRKTQYQVDATGIQMQEKEGTAADAIFLPWSEVISVQETKALFLLFVDGETLLIVPKRSLKDVTAFRAFLPSSQAS